MKTKSFLDDMKTVYYASVSIFCVDLIHLQFQLLHLTVKWLIFVNIWKWSKLCEEIVRSLMIYFRFLPWIMMNTYRVFQSSNELTLKHIECHSKIYMFLWNKRLTIVLKINSYLSVLCLKPNDHDYILKNRLQCK